MKDVFKVVSDLICPWCYIGKRRLEAAVRTLPARKRAGSLISWHPFQLNPDMPPEGMDREEYCRRKFGSWDCCEQMFAQICEVGKSVGLNFRFDLQARVPNTFAAHRVIWLAGQQGVQDAIVETLFHAYFCDGVDLSRNSDLIEVAVDSGLERLRLERMLNSAEGIAEVKAEEQEIKTLGVSAVPLFIIHDRVAVSGAQPPEMLLKAFEQSEEPQQKRRGRTKHEMAPASEPGPLCS